MSLIKRRKRIIAELEQKMLQMADIGKKFADLKEDLRIVEIQLKKK